MEGTLTRSLRRLPADTASRIAAGEVIARPLAALKEILENALDAGARAVEIRVDGALDRRFVVADDGSGIAAADLELALERHATSKIETLEDLDRLQTLGFRGEALPSIAAVSRMRLTSRPANAEGAAFLAVDGGVVTERGSAARAPGTTVEVADLFHNTPARRKFLGTPGGELRAAIRMIECYALAFPGVAFRLLVDDRVRLEWPAASDHRARAAAIWGASHADQLLESTATRDGLEVQVLLGLPEHARATREHQIVLVNRRWIQSPLIGQALRRAYGNLLPEGRFPWGVVWISIPPDRLDVNVHPTKREVRFAEDGPVFSLVAAVAARPLATLHPPFTVVPGGAGSAWADRVSERPADPDQLTLGPLSPRVDAATPAAAPPAAREPRTLSEPEMWQLHRTYILAPVRGGLVIIDQHAAHERILYEQALARFQGAEGASQQLLFPALVDLSRSQFERLLEIGPWLHQLGWDLTLLGPPSVVIRGVPGEVRTDAPGVTGVPLILMPGMKDESQIARRVAADQRAAIHHAGDALQPAEMSSLVNRLFGTSRPHGDPHGRVTYVRLDLEELHRRFGRS